MSGNLWNYVLKNQILNLKGSHNSFNALFWGLNYTHSNFRISFSLMSLNRKINGIIEKLNNFSFLMANGSQTKYRNERPYQKNNNNNN